VSTLFIEASTLFVRLWIKKVIVFGFIFYFACLKYFKDIFCIKNISAIADRCDALRVHSYVIFCIFVHFIRFLRFLQAIIVLLSCYSSKIIQSAYVNHW